MKMNISEIQLKLIQEMKKDCNEILWQLGHPLYKNNCLRRSKWAEISDAIGLNPVDCSSMWKGLKSKHSRSKVTLASLKSAKGGTYQRLKIAKIKEFINEMNYFENQKDFDDKPATNMVPAESNISPSSSRIVIREDGLEVNHPRKYRVLLPKPVNHITRVHSNELKVEPGLTSLRTIENPYEEEELADVIKQSNRISKSKDKEKPYDQFGKYVADELRQLPPRQAILLQQKLQNCITKVKLNCLEPEDSSNTQELLHVDVNSPFSSPSEPSPFTDDSKDYDVLSQSLITTFGANDK